MSKVIMMIEIGNWESFICLHLPARNYSIIYGSQSIEVQGRRKGIVELELVLFSNLAMFNLEQAMQGRVYGCTTSSRDGLAPAGCISPTSVNFTVVDRITNRPWISLP